jgi:spermidine dehydrogenase
LTPAAQVAAQPWRYPPALTGLRGQHDGSFEIAHQFAREGRSFSFDAVAAEERYDLVVVGGGLSGLAAAWFYRQAAGPRARILVLDNHDDFGGHAKRNEFTHGGRLIIGYGGSESLQSPTALFSDTAHGSTWRASTPRSSARSIPRSACHAASSSRARASAATSW